MKSVFDNIRSGVLRTDHGIVGPSETAVALLLEKVQGRGSKTAIALRQPCLAQYVFGYPYGGRCNKVDPMLDTLH